MIFQDRTGTNLNRKKIKIISQTPTEIIADIERADTPVVEGTTINANVFNTFQGEINLANTNSSTAVSVANTANTNSLEAKDSANEAKNNANNALVIANEAKSNASSATTVSNEAKSLSNEAKTIATNASNDVSSAITTANNANSQAANALNIANEAIENATSALEIANNSNEDSSNALEIANNANNNVSSAITTASNASTTAQSALELANSASTNASKALTDATTAINKAGEIETNFNTFITSTEYLKKAYPVGSIYISVNSTSPASLFGGTWQQLKDRFLIGCGDSYSNGATGGSSSHSHGLNNGYAKILYTWINDWNRIVLQTKENVSYSTNFKGGDMNGYGWSTNTVGSATALGGSTDSTSNIPPYLAVYMWKRVS